MTLIYNNKKITYCEVNQGYRFGFSLFLDVNECNVAMEIRLTSPQDFGVMNTCVVDRVHKSAILESAVNFRCCCYKTLLKRAYLLTVHW